MGFLVGTPLMRKYYSQKLQAEKQGDLIKGQLSLKIRNLKNKLKQKKKK